MTLVNFSQERRRFQQLRKPLAQGFGGGDNGGMDLEARVDRLEASVGRVESTLVDLNAFMRATVPTLATKAGMAEVKGAVDAKPSKSFVISTVVAILGLVLASIAVAPYLRVPT